MHQVTLNYYDIKQCGFYKHGAENASFAPPADVFDWFKCWAENRPFAKTTTYHIDERAGGPYLEAYCYDIACGDNGDYCLTTWNRSPDSEGKVLSVPIDAEVGNAEPEETSLPEDSITGYPTYFWIVPEHDFLITIRLEGQLVNGHRPMRRLIEEFLAKFSPWVDEAEKNQYAKLRVKGYNGSFDPEKEDSSHHWPRFRTELHDLPGNIPYIRANVGAIRKIIRKNRIPDLSSDERSWLKKHWDRFFDGFTGLPETPPSGAKCRLEVSHQPTSEEVEALIQTYLNESETQWNDVGFEFERKIGDTKWLSRSLPRLEPDLDIDPGPTSLVSAPDLLEALKSDRDTLLKPVL